MSKRSGGTPYKIASAVKVARRLYDQFSPRTTAKSMPKRKSSSLTGHYKGRLPAPKRAPVAGKYALRGHRAETERYIANRGSNDVCYVGAQVAPAGSVGQSVGVALLRMIMKRHYQLEYSSTDQLILPQAISGTAFGFYLPHSIRFWRKRTLMAGAPTYDVASTAIYIFNVTDTVASFGVWFSEHVFSSEVFGATTSVTVNNFTQADNWELHAYQFVEVDSASTVPQALRAGPVVPLEGQYVSVYSVTRVHIQNVTPADGLEAGAVFQTTRIDANPLKGVLMRFKHPTPMVKDAAVGSGIDGSGSNDYGWTLQQDVNGDGLILPGALPPTGPWTQLPSADMFKNCVGVSSITLEPGDIKDYSLSFRFNGTLQVLMKGFCNSLVGTGGVSIPTPSTLNKQFGQSFLFALEKRMPTGPAQVSLNIHYENYYGSVFGGRRKTPMTRQARSLGATVVDNN